VYDGAEVHLYTYSDANGLKKDTDTATETGAITTNDSNAMIGRQPGGDFQYFPGSVDDVGIWSTALTQAEIQYVIDNGVCNFIRCKAHTPSPDDGTTATPDEDRKLALSWTAGEGAASHDVYFGTDYNDVNDATVSTPVIYRGNQSATTYTPPEALNLDAEYFWRIDEVNVTTVKGDTWDLTTAECVSIDDFEAYLDTDSCDPNLLGTWEELGWGDVSLSYSGVSDPCYHGGQQSMKLVYLTDVMPYYSAAGLTYATAKDWTAASVKAMELWFVGEADNNSTPLYVELEDSSARTATVLYTDANAVKSTEWTVFRIDLQDFVLDNPNIDLQNVKKLSVGLGDGLDPGQITTGTVYFDDIVRCISRCLYQPAPESGNVNDDCVIDFKDVAVMCENWLEHGMWP
jgi:hypothetical protein